MDTLFCATEQSILFMELFHICNILYAQLYCNIKMQFIHRFVTISKNHLEFLLKSTSKKNFPLCANAGIQSLVGARFSGDNPWEAFRGGI